MLSIQSDLLKRYSLMWFSRIGYFQVYVIVRRRRKAGSPLGNPLEPAPPKQPSYHMPPIKVPLANASRNQAHASGAAIIAACKLHSEP